MKLGEKGVSYLSLPPNMQTPEHYAICAAFDYEMGRLMEFYHKLLVWPDLEHLNPRYYDYAAATLRSPYYSSQFDDDTKLQALKSTLKTYRYAGTITAIEEALGNLFLDAVFVPWYEYDGEPYHFKVVAPTDPSEESIQRFLEIFSKIKAQRSIIDLIETPSYIIPLQVFGVSGLVVQEKIKEEIG